MHTAQIVFCFALLGLAGQAGAEETPYRHEYLNGGYFEGAPEVAQAPSSEPTAVRQQQEAAPYRHSHRNGGHFDGEAAAPGGKAAARSAQTGK